MWHIPNQTGAAAVQKHRWEERDSHEEFLEEIRCFHQEDPEDFLAQIVRVLVPSLYEEPEMQTALEEYEDRYNEIRYQMDEYEQHFPYGPA